MSRIRGKASDGRHETIETVVGIDVSKAHLDVCLHPSGDRFRVANDATGHRELRTRCTADGVGRAMMEVTGRYHRAAHACLHDAGIQVAIENPTVPGDLPMCWVGSPRRTRLTPKFLPSSQP